MGTKSVSIHTFALSFLLCIAAGAASAQSGATTPDALVDGLLQSIEERNLVNYDLALDSEFTFHFAPEDVDRVPGGIPFWERATELAAIQRLFSGQTGTGPSGDPLPAVQSITVVANALDNWGDGGDAGPEFAGTQRRRWQLDFDIRYTGGNLVTAVSNQHEFFVVQRDTDWQLFAWREMNPVLKILNESSTWGAVKLGYADVVIANEKPGWSELKSLW